MRIAMNPWSMTTITSTTSTTNTGMQQALRQGQSTSILTSMKRFCIPIHTSRTLTIGTGTRKPSFSLRYGISAMLCWAGRTTNRGQTPRRSATELASRTANYRLALSVATLSRHRVEVAV